MRGDHDAVLKRFAIERYSDKWFDAGCADTEVVLFIARGEPNIAPHRNHHTGLRDERAFQPKEHISKTCLPHAGLAELGLHQSGISGSECVRTPAVTIT